jgi:hypothetical protein
MRTRLAVCLLFVLVVGCGSRDPGENNAAALTGDGHKSTESCIASLHWLQKDAYAKYPGRTTELLPSHTTTRLIVECRRDGAEEAERVATVDHANHGTAPDTVSADGVPMLVEEVTQTAKGTRAELTALATAMQSCECDAEGGTQFLSTHVPDAEFLTAVASSLDGSTGCEPLVEALRASGDAMSHALPEAAAQCHPAPPDTVPTVFTRTMKQELEARGDRPSDYHVCNNDARLQGELFRRFATEHIVVRCDAGSPICRDPKFYLDPGSISPR